MYIFEVCAHTRLRARSDDLDSESRIRDFYSYRIPEIREISDPRTILDTASDLIVEGINRDHDTVTDIPDSDTRARVVTFSHETIAVDVCRLEGAHWSRSYESDECQRDDRENERKFHREVRNKYTTYMDLFNYVKNKF